jgi:hypothetical protein
MRPHDADLFKLRHCERRQNCRSLCYLLTFLSFSFNVGMASTTQKPDRVEALKELLSSRENCRAFFFYSGAFIIDLFWGLIWSLLENFMIHQLHESAGLLDVLAIIAAFGNVLFSLIFGYLASVQKRFWLRGKTGILLRGIFCIGLVVFWWLFWTIGNYISTKQDGANTLIYGLCILFFLLTVAILNGYSAIFFAISTDFSNQLVSRPALPIWSALGQIGSIVILYFSPVLFGDSAYFFIMLGVISGIAITFTAISMGTTYIGGLTSEKSTEMGSNSHESSSLSKKFCNTLESWGYEKVAFVTYSAVFCSFALFPLKFTGHYWFANSFDGSAEKFV